jgi:hypothetical protein
MLPRSSIITNHLSSILRYIKSFTLLNKALNPFCKTRSQDDSNVIHL